MSAENYSVQDIYSHTNDWRIATREKQGLRRYSTCSRICPPSQKRECFKRCQPLTLGKVLIHPRQLLCSRVTGCAVKRRWSTAGVNPPGNWFAPPGSNQSSSGGNETAEASGADSR